MSNDKLREAIKKIAVDLEGTIAEIEQIVDRPGHHDVSVMCGQLAERQQFLEQLRATLADSADTEIGEATQRAMAGPEIPHNEAGVPIMPEADSAGVPHCQICGNIKRDPKRVMGIGLGEAMEATDTAFFCTGHSADDGGVLGARTIERSVEPDTHGEASIDREVRPLSAGAPPEPTEEMVEAGAQWLLRVNYDAWTEWEIARWVLQAALAAAQKEGK